MGVSMAGQFHNVHLGKRARAAVLSVFSVGLVAGLVWYLYRNADQYAHLLDVSTGRIVALFLAALAFPLFNGMQDALLFRSLGASDFSYADGFLTAATSSLANQLPLPGGLVSKALYMKRRYDMPFTLFASATMALFVIYVALDGLLGLLVLLGWALFQGVAASPALWAGFGLMACSLLLFLFPSNRLVLPVGIQVYVQRALQGWMYVRRNPRMVLKVLGLQLVMILLTTLRYKIAFGMLSQHPSLSQLLLMSSASILTQMVSIAPGGLGVRETIVGTVAAVMGFGPAVSVAAVALDRLVAVSEILLVGAVTSIILAHRVAGGASEPLADENDRWRS